MTTVAGRAGGVEPPVDAETMNKINGHLKDRSADCKPRKVRFSTFYDCKHRNYKTSFVTRFPLKFHLNPKPLSYRNVLWWNAAEDVATMILLNVFQLRRMESVLRRWRYLFQILAIIYLLPL